MLLVQFWSLSIICYLTLFISLLLTLIHLPLYVDLSCFCLFYLICYQQKPNIYDEAFFSKTFAENFIKTETPPLVLSCKFCVSFKTTFYTETFGWCFWMHTQCCSTFSWIELQVLLRCCLIHMSIIMLRHFLHLLCLCLCLDLGLFMSYLCDLFWFSSSFSLSLMVWSHECRHACFFAYFLEYVPLFVDDSVDVECE